MSEKESDSSQNLDQKMISLTRENELLKEEKEKLVKQFNNAIKISETVDSLVEENKKTSAELLKSRMDNDELTKRLVIIANKLKEIEESKKQEISQLECKHEAEKKEYYQNSADSKVFVDTKIKDLEEKNLKAQKDLEKKEKQIEELELMQKNLICCFNEAFHAKINNAEQLLSFINEGKKDLNEEETQTLETMKIEQEISEFDSQKDIELEIKEAQKSIKSKLKEQHKKETERLKEMHIREIETLKYNFGQLAQNNANLKKKIKAVTEESGERLAEVTALKTKLELLEKKHEKESIDEIFELNSKLKETLEENKEIKAENKRVKKQIAALISNSSALEDEIRKLKERNELIEEENRKLGNAAKSLELQNSSNNDKVEELQNRADDLNTALKASTVDNNAKKNEIKRLELDINKTKQEAAFSESLANSLKEELKKLEETNRELISSAEENEKQRKEQNNRITESEKAILKLQNENSQLKERLQNAQAPLSEGSLLPLGYWSCEEFPKELTQLVNDIAANNTYKAPTKLRNVLKVVAKWYMSKIDRINAQYEVQTKEFDEEKERTKEFADFVADLFKNANINLSNIFEEKSLWKEVQSYLNGLEDKENCLEKRNNELEQCVLTILTTLDAEDIEQAMELVEELKKGFVSMEKLYYKQASQTKKVAKKSLVEIQQKEEELKQREDEISVLKENIKEAKEDLEKMKLRVEEIQQKSEENITEMQEKHEKEVKENRIKFNSENRTLKQTIEEQINKTETVKKINTELKKEVTKLQNKVQQLEEQLELTSSMYEEKVQIVNSLKEQLIGQRKEAKLKTEDERKLYEARCKQTNGILKLKNSDYKATVDDLNHSVSELTEKNQEQEEKNSLLELRIQKLTLQLNSLKEELSREKSINESQLRAQKLAIESQYNQQVMELNTKAEQTKRDMIAFIGLEFCSIFDIKSKLNETNFEIFIRNIKRRFESFMDQDNKLRSILNIGPKQSIIDSVGALLLNQKE